MRIPFVCLLLLFGTVLSQDVTERYRKFINQHIKGDMSAGRCTSVIGGKSISESDNHGNPTNQCKGVNTFIRATTNHVKTICGAAGEPYPGGLTKSLLPFDIVVCELRNQQARLPRCEYRGQARTRRIAIRCEQGLPVHFGRDIIHFEN